MSLMKKRILVVDDEQIILFSLSLKLKKQGYEVTSETTAEEAIQRVKRERFDLIILDVVMPDMDGVEAFTQLKKIRPATPVVMLSGKASTERAVEIMKMGASDYISKPVGPGKELSMRIERAIEKNELLIQNRQLMRQLTQANRELEIDKKLLEEEASHLQIALEGTVNSLATMVEMKDSYTAGHQRRVSRLACAIAREMGLPDEEIGTIHMAGALHDIGKISVPAEILNKPSELSETEMDLIKMHPRVAYDILKEIEFPWPIAEMVFQHHERMDGSGYPRGLSAEEICLGARVLGVADVVEAMSSHRPYRPALGIDRALQEISQNKGVLYDPEVVDACQKFFREEPFKLDYETMYGTSQAGRSKEELKERASDIVGEA